METQIDSDVLAGTVLIGFQVILTTLRERSSHFIDEKTPALSQSSQGQAASRWLNLALHLCCLSLYPKLFL